MMGSEWGDIGWWGMGIGMIVWVLVPAAIIGLVVWLMNRTQGRSDSRRDDSAEEVLRRRFAGGEIDGEEYERRLALLRRFDDHPGDATRGRRDAVARNR